MCVKSNVMRMVRMNTSPEMALPRLAEAPHRLLFFVGTFNVLAMMLWWTLWLIGQHWPVLALPQSPIPAGWVHALMMPLQVLAPFMFGFLLTVFPRWMNQPALSRWHYLPVGLGLFGGQVLMLVGLWGANRAAPGMHSARSRRWPWACWPGCCLLPGCTRSRTCCGCSRRSRSQCSDLRCRSISPCAIACCRFSPAW
ncbi:MAG: hypothetical protein CVV12_06865 [Gammaproteobacteria bacterium HGW-Gammaproteobacteria-2]|nr:MAG: hypothetical protein CVV12_06865 [Gammaproteobacteria bacterium HGW-Gammaproteobacteria-2]